MGIQSIKIVTNHLYFGLIERDEEVYQTLEIHKDGAVYFESRLFGDSFKYEEIMEEVGREITLKIDEDIVEDIFKTINDVIMWSIFDFQMTDIGDWKLYIVHDDKTLEYGGPLCGLGLVDFDLSAYISERIPIDNLKLFGTDYDEDDEL